MSLWTKHEGNCDSSKWKVNCDVQLGQCDSLEIILAYEADDSLAAGVVEA